MAVGEVAAVAEVAEGSVAAAAAVEDKRRKKNYEQECENKQFTKNPGYYGACMRLVSSGVGRGEGQRCVIDIAVKPKAIRQREGGCRCARASGRNIRSECFEGNPWPGRRRYHRLRRSGSRQESGNEIRGGGKTEN